MNKNFGSSFFLLIFFSVWYQTNASIVFVILSQPTEYFEEKSQLLKESIEKQASENDVQVRFA